MIVNTSRLISQALALSAVECVQVHPWPPCSNRQPSFHPKLAQRPWLFFFFFGFSLCRFPNVRPHWRRSKDAVVNFTPQILTTPFFRSLRPDFVEITIAARH